MKLHSEVVGSDRDGPLLRKLRNIHSFELERRLGLDPKPSPERFVEPKYVCQLSNPSKLLFIFHLPQDMAET